VRRVALNLAAMAERSLRRRARALLRLAPGTVKSRLARGRAAMAGSLDHDSSEVTS
jgi:DNA-directed RNA polymerase specialized sigma24 family protein